MSKTASSAAEQVESMTTALNTLGSAPAPEPEPPTEMSPEIQRKLEQQHDLNRKATALADAMAAQQFEAVRVIGQMQTFEAFRSLAAAGNTKLFQQMKVSKAYKKIRVPQKDGSIRTINTFEEFCELMGTSYSKVAEDLQNLAVFGESFMESSKRIGIGYRDLRKLRALPEEDRALVIEGEKVGNDPEALKDMIEELAGRNAKLKEQIKEKDATLKARDEVLKKRNTALDVAQAELVRLKSLPPDAQALLKGKKEQDALKNLHSHGLKLLGYFTAYLSAARSLMEMEEASPAMHEMAVTITSGLCSVIAEDLLETGIDIDFRILTYPLELGDIALRGDAERLPDTGE